MYVGLCACVCVRETTTEKVGQCIGLPEHTGVVTKRGGVKRGNAQDSGCVEVL